MAALGWLLDLGFAGSAAAADYPVSWQHLHVEAAATFAAGAVIAETFAAGAVIAEVD